MRKGAHGSKQPPVELPQAVVAQAEALQSSQTQQSGRWDCCYGVIGQIDDADERRFSESHRPQSPDPVVLKIQLLGVWMQPSRDVVEASSPAVYHFGVAVAAALLRTGVGIRQKGEEGTHQDHCGELQCVIRQPKVCLCIRYWIKMLIWYNPFSSYREMPWKGLFNGQNFNIVSLVWRIHCRLKYISCLGVWKILLLTLFNPRWCLFCAAPHRWTRK